MTNLTKSLDPLVVVPQLGTFTMKQWPSFVLVPFQKIYCSQKIVKQECIPVGCVPPAAVALGGGGASFRGVLPAGGPPSWGVSLPGGCLLPGDASFLLGDVSLLGGLLPARGVSLPGGCLLPGGSPCWGVPPSWGGLPAGGVPPSQGGLLDGRPPCEQNDKQV